VQARDRRPHIRLARIRRQFLADGADADLGRVTVLAGDVAHRAWIAADEQRAEPRHDAPLRERRHPLLQLALDRARRRDAVEYPCAHVSSGKVRTFGAKTRPQPAKARTFADPGGMVRPRWWAR